MFSKQHHGVTDLTFGLAVVTLTFYFGTASCRKLILCRNIGSGV